MGHRHGTGDDVQPLPAHHRSLALAASLAKKKPTPFTVGTMRTDTFTFGCVLLGTIILVGALLFLPVAALGPIADHFAPMPFGG